MAFMESILLRACARDTRIRGHMNTYIHIYIYFNVVLGVRHVCMCARACVQVFKDQEQVMMNT